MRALESAPLDDIEKRAIEEAVSILMGRFELEGVHSLWV